VRALVRRDIEDLPSHLAEAVIAVEVAHNFRRDDIHAIARRLAPSYQGWCPEREKFLYTLIVRHLQHDGCKPAQTYIEARCGIIELCRDGETNVIRLQRDGVRGMLRAVVLREKNLADGERRAEGGRLYRLTRRRIGNDNDPGFEAPIRYGHKGGEMGPMISPGLMRRMKVMGRVAELMKRPGIQLRNGRLEGGAE
jgi:hypothetical protein